MTAEPTLLSGASRFAWIVVNVRDADRSKDYYERFTALRSCYLFEAFYCRPGKDGAHEKGGVEGEVGRFRRRHMVPVPKVSSLADLNELAGRLTSSRSRFRQLGSAWR